MLEKTESELLADWAYGETGGVVQSGPFKGMKMLREESWGTSSLCPCLLGCYEAELHKTLEFEIDRLSKIDNPRVVNVGCAEGYYAVGLAMRLPDATVWAIDRSEDSLEVTARAAEANGVTLKMRDDIDNSMSMPDLVVADCEGAEVLYLDKERWPLLAKSTIVVELHDTMQEIGNRFRDSHEIYMAFEGARNPSEFPMLMNKSSAFRWAMVDEGRPCGMQWFFMRPKVTM